MKKKILMIYPKFPVTYWSFKHSLPFIGKKASFPPLGLLTVAAMLPDTYEVRVLDMNVEKLDERMIEAADMVFVSAMIIQKPSFEKVVAHCNRLGKTVVAGGPYPTSSHGEIKGVDHFVLNEAEITLPKFISDYEAGTARPLYEDDAKPDITATPAPRFDLIDVSHYSNMLVQFSRGCPFMCEFCDIIEMYGRKMRTKTVDQFMRELDAVRGTGFRGGVFVVDDNFIGKKSEVKKLLGAMISWQEEHGYPFTFFTEASINCAEDEELLALLSRAGFDMLFIGIETPDAAALQSANKVQNLNIDLEESIRRIQARGIEVTGGFIVGFDTDDETIFRRQIDFIQSAGIPVAMVGLLTALPNTRLHRRLKAEGRLVSGSTGNNTHDLRLNFRPVLNAESLIAGYKRIISRIYSPGQYFSRALKLLRNLPARKTSYRKVTGSQIRALVRSLLFQTFSRYGLSYLAFLARSVMINIRLFPEAIGLAVKGHHLFTMTSEMRRVEAFESMLASAKEKLKNRLSRIAAYDKKDLQRAADAYAGLILARIRKRYRRLEEDTRLYMNDRLGEFEAYCQNLVSGFKLDPVRAL
jgi:radical SAM superfamily enzyme YgiQ (UPF0313 family)